MKILDEKEVKSGIFEEKNIKQLEVKWQIFQNLRKFKKAEAKIVKKKSRKFWVKTDQHPIYNLKNSIFLKKI